MAVLGVLGPSRLAMADDDLDMFIDLAATHGRMKRKFLANISQGHHPEEQPKGVTSKLARLLVESWSLGEIGAKTVQILASAACADGSSHPDLVKLAGLGGHGNTPGTCHRGLVNALNTWVQLPAPALSKFQ